MHKNRPNNYSLCKFGDIDTKATGIDNWSIQISPAKADIGVKLQQKKTAINFCSFDNMRSSIHTCLGLNVHNQLLLWMCVVLHGPFNPAMTSGVLCCLRSGSTANAALLCLCYLCAPTILSCEVPLLLVLLKKRCFLFEKTSFSKPAP